jgi:D-alanyl-D-alanine carboxypeptidase/D-alanyl-D-alanine-endopeptidase (penicillin-binding protein 4)
MRINISFLFLFGLFLGASSCSVSKQISKVAKKEILNQPELISAHIGISVYNPSSNKYLYDYNGDKYFIPASNTKIITCYAAMKYLGDTLVGMRYKRCGDTLYVIPAGDPTFLHKDFNFQPVLNFLRPLDTTSIIELSDNNFQEAPWGFGWSWDDYAEDYMAERSAMPIYGNVVEFAGNVNRWNFFPSGIDGNVIDSGGKSNSYLTKVTRDLAVNKFTLYFNGAIEKKIDVPFYTNKGETNLLLLQQICKARISRNTDSFNYESKNGFNILHSQPTDSLLKIMMHRSDNFFAEQSLLMVSNELLGVMNDEKIIDTLLKTDFKNMRQKPNWVDGSGLSRYNLFTPNDFVFILSKMRNEFSWNRITTIFATGGTGTLGNTYKNLTGKIYAKTGTLSNNAASSGYIITSKGKLLIFSVLIGNHLSTGSTIRNRIAKFLETIIKRY